MKLQLYFHELTVQRFINLNNRVLKIYEDTKIDKDALWNRYQKEAEENIRQLPTNYNPEYHDYSDLADIWNEQMSDYAEIFQQAVDGQLYQYITMLCQTWENQLISFCIEEIERTLEFKKHPSYGDIINFLKKQIGKENIGSLDKITELRWLVNVIKHGEGNAAKSLREKRPDYFSFNSSLDLEKHNDRLVIFDSVFLDTEALNVKEKDFYDYHEAITDFWKSMPERVLLDI